MFLVDQWKKISHSNLVSLREVFTTKSFGDNCKSCSFASSKVLAFLGYRTRILNIFYLSHLSLGSNTDSN